MMYDKVDTRPSKPPRSQGAPRWESIRIIVSRCAAALWALQMLSAQLTDLLYVLYAPYMLLKTRVRYQRYDSSTDVWSNILKSCNKISSYHLKKDSSVRSSIRYIVVYIISKARQQGQNFSCSSASVMSVTQDRFCSINATQEHGISFPHV